MSYHQLVEGARNLIIDYLKTNLSAQLDLVASKMGKPFISLESPVEYYIYPKPAGHRLPAVFVICDNVDFRIQQQKANFINAMDLFKVSILVEDQDAEALTVKADRYLSALHQTLDEADIVSSDQTLALKSIAYRASFSETYMRAEGSGDGGKFRKEVLLECQIEHNENF